MAKLTAEQVFYLRGEYNIRNISDLCEDFLENCGAADTNNGCEQCCSLMNESCEILAKDCQHPEIANVDYPTHSGCTFIHERVCTRCGKVLSHGSEPVMNPDMQKVFQH
jgi:hypothetical protein